MTGVQPQTARTSEEANMRAAILGPVFTSLMALLQFWPFSIGHAQRTPSYAGQLAGTWRTPPLGPDGGYEVFHFEPLDQTGIGTFVYILYRADNSEEMHGKGQYRFTANNLIEQKLHLEIIFYDNLGRQQKLPWYFVSNVTDNTLTLTVTYNAGMQIDLVRVPKN
jgi:hypothetical protein